MRACLGMGEVWHKKRIKERHNYMGVPLGGLGVPLGSPWFLGRPPWFPLVPKFSNSTETPYEIEIPLIIPLLEEFTRAPVTLGDHLRRRRIKLGLYQKDVAARLGVTTPTVWNWENRGSVDLRFIPRVIEFLGYNPIPQPEDLLEQPAWYKLVNGLALEQLGVAMGRDPEQLADCLSQVQGRE